MIYDRKIGIPGVTINTGLMDNVKIQQFNPL